MIFPADEPLEAVLSKVGGSVRLVLDAQPVGEVPSRLVRKEVGWVTGRAGMEYRDLIPGRLDGKVIASHIRIPNGGEVADYVHYHKVGFQMIYCVAGAIRVVYEDQGPPFWLKPGDCVLQPPEIRHRVLEAEANSEVVEVSAPAVHETWADHDMNLPNGRVIPGREFGGQRFVRTHRGRIGVARERTRRLCDQRHWNLGSVGRCGRGLQARGRSPATIGRRKE